VDRGVEQLYGLEDHLEVQIAVHGRGDAGEHVQHEDVHPTTRGQKKTRQKIQKKKCQQSVGSRVSSPTESVMSCE
jgi:hypothetical protein